MVRFRVRATALSEVASLLDAVVVTFDANLAAVNAQVNSTVGAGWQGEDAESFGEGWSMFVATAAMVRQSLVALQAGLIAADGSYTQTESGVRRTFTGQVGMMRNVAGAAQSVNARVDTGEERAELIEEFYGRGDDKNVTAGFVGGGGIRASSGQSAGTGPSDADDADAAGSAGEGFIDVDIDPAIVPEGAPVVDVVIGSVS